MPRSPCFRKALRAWYVLHQGRQLRLGTTKSEAYAAWQQILASGREADATTTVGELCDRFLAWCRENRAPPTCDLYGRFLNTFRQQNGTRPAATLRPFHVSDWLTHRGYDGSTGNCAARIVVRLCNWAAKHGVFKPDPLTGLARPAAVLDNERGP